MLTPRRPTARTLAGTVLLLFVFAYVLYPRRPASSHASQQATSDPIVAGATAANTTLGFGAIAVISRGPGSTRYHALMQAANVTELDLVVPEQPVWTADDLAEYQEQDGTDGAVQKSEGSALAWLGHINALKWFLDSDLETVMIIEDDVDWDIRLRSQQVPLVASAVRSLVQHVEPARYFWGQPSDWDLLYLGHCGDYLHGIDDGIGPALQSAGDLAALAHRVFPDASLPARANLHPYTAALLEVLRVPDRHRVVHASKFPLCTFAYAVSRPAARRLVDDFAPTRRAALHRQSNIGAFDVAVLHACTAAAGGMRCLSANPELFHHRPGLSVIASIEQSKGHLVGRPPVDVAADDTIARTGETINIDCGFWSGHFAFGDDTDQLEYFRRQVGRQGRCLKPNRTDDASVDTYRAAVGVA